MVEICFGIWLAGMGIGMAALLSAFAYMVYKDVRDD